jgi:hypothetical protein
MAFCIRPSAMLLMIPMGIVILSFSIGDYHQTICRDSIKGFLRGAICMILIAVIGEVSLLLPMINKEYREANASNVARVQMFDYAGVPQFEEVSGLLDGNVTKEKLEAFANYLILDWDYSDGNIQRVAEYAKRNISHPSISTILKVSYDVLFKNEFGMISSILLPLIAIALIGIVVSRKFWLFIQMIAFHIAIAISLGYTVYVGRMPGRVLYPIIFSETVYLICIVIFTLPSEEEKTVFRILKRITMVAAVAAVIYYSLLSAREQYRYIKGKMHTEELLNGRYEMVVNYCNSNPDSLYVISYEIYMYTYMSVLEKCENGNYIFSGGWYSFLPESLEYIKEYLGHDKKCYFIFDGDTPQIVIDAKLDYLEQYFGEEPEEADEFMTPTGGTCKVYCVRR